MIWGCASKQYPTFEVFFLISQLRISADGSAASSPPVTIFSSHLKQKKCFVFARARGVQVI